MRFPLRAQSARPSNSWCLLHWCAVCCSRAISTSASAHAVNRPSTYATTATLIEARTVDPLHLSSTQWATVTRRLKNCPKGGHSTPPEYAGSAKQARGRRSRCVPPKQALGEHLNPILPWFSPAAKLSLAGGIVSIPPARCEDDPMSSSW